MIYWSRGPFLWQRSKKKHSQTSTLIEMKYSKYTVILYLSLIVLCELFFFRMLLAADKLPGDIGDGRLCNLISEHWLHVVQAREAAADLSEFYPNSNTLSYSDCFLGAAFLYVPLRVLGADFFSAYKISILFLHFLGSLSLFAFLAYCLNLKKSASFLGVLCFSFSNCYAIRMSIHVQMVYISLLPLVLYSFGLAYRHLASKCKRRLFAAIGIVLWVLIAYSSWYIFYFSILFVAILLICLLIEDCANNKKLLFKLWNLPRQYHLELITYTVCFFILLVPLVMLYLPTASLNGLRSWDEIVKCSPWPCDIVNVGEHNFIFGSLFKADMLAKIRDKYEYHIDQGWSIAFIVVLGFLLVQYRKHYDRYVRHDNSSTVVKALIMSLLFAPLLIVDIHGYSLWYIVYKLMPGAGSLRMIARWWFFLLLPASILLAFLLSHYKFKSRHSMAVIAVLVWLTNINCIKTTRSKYFDQELLACVPPPPPKAKIIGMYTTGKINDKFFDTNYQLDAWQIADHYGVKTINGYSGLFPPSFKLLSDYCTTLLYPITAMKYKNINGIRDDIYLYNVHTRTWSLCPSSYYPPIELNKIYQFSQEGWASCLGDFYGTESWGRGVGPSSCILLKIPSTSQATISMTIQSLRSPREVNILVNGRSVGSPFIAELKSSTFSFEIPPAFIPEGKTWIDLVMAREEYESISYTLLPESKVLEPPLLWLIDLKVSSKTPKQ